MHDTLVKRLRELHPEEFGNAWDFAFACQQAMNEAADALEEMSMKLHGDEAAIAGMQREIERMVVAGRPRWIPVTERLPEANKEVYVSDGEYIARANLLDDVFPGDKPCWSYSGIGEITHWCEQIPLPQPPKEGNNG